MNRYMKVVNKIFSGLLCVALCCSNAAAGDCTSEIYRLHNLDECGNVADTGKKSVATTVGLAAGTLALIGGAIALFSASSDAATPAPTSAMPTLPKYDMVGADISEVQLSSILDSTDYKKNSNQYNDIRLAYSLARGFTGAGSKTAVFDSGENTVHGGNVAYFASGQIAPNANVSSYLVADRYGDFKSFYEIGNEIDNATNAQTNIYNFSWSATNIYATEIRNTRQMINTTDQNFINSLVNAANQNDAIFVWAAGNNSASESSALSALPVHIDELQGHFVNVVAWDSETGALADFSNACGITKEYCITAPGTNLETPLSDNPLNGTSFATPIVSAAIAVIREAFPYMKSNEITDLLFTTARDLGNVGVDEVYGHGLLDLERATRPVGTPLVAVSDEFAITMRRARISAPIGRKIQSKNLTFAFVDDFGRTFNTNLNDNITLYNRSIAQEHLQQHNETSAQIANIEIGFKQTNILNSDSFLQTSSGNIMTFVRHNGNISFGNATLFHKTSFGITAPNRTPDSMISSFSNIYTASVTVGAKYGDFSLSVGTPDTIIYGNMNLNTLSGRAVNGDYIFTQHTIDLASVPSIEYKASYKSFSAGFVDNPSGRDEVYVIAKTKISF